MTNSTYPIIKGVVVPPRRECYPGRSTRDDTEHLAFISAHTAANPTRGAMIDAIRQRFELVRKREQSFDSFRDRLRKKLRAQRNA
jgi:hypothetical protein